MLTAWGTHAILQPSQTDGTRACAGHGRRAAGEEEVADEVAEEVAAGERQAHARRVRGAAGAHALGADHT